ncbi:DNA mismatch repair protein MutS, partial [bacterium]|nr:DNA mismatch repair protein MutS [bacterium]
GTRMLKRWLLRPLLKVDSIVSRQECISSLVSDSIILAKLRETLGKIGDLERLLSKMVLGGRNPRDLFALSNSLSFLPEVKETLQNTKLSFLSERIYQLQEVSEKILNSLRSELPMTLSEGGVIADGVDPRLDELRALLRDGDCWLREYEEKERATTGIKTLKVRKNSVFGFFIEISKSFIGQAPSHYVRKQTLANGERYISADLKDYESKIFSANDRLIALEKEIFEGLIEIVRGKVQEIQSTAEAVAEIDSLASLSQIARERGFIRPNIVDEEVIAIVEGKHPVVEAFLPSGSFVPNEASLDSEDHRIAIITGPNMAGKSTYLRQVALIVLLAQIGSFVPAQEATIGVVDRIFTRVGASDNLVRGQSTFMVEMMETSAILNNATRKSFLILDEIGRGTSTFDGLSLAWAIIEYIHEKIGARTLFATHYHELTDLEFVRPGIFNLNVAVSHQDSTGEVVFLHKIQNGAANKSYGIEVAKLAGIPTPVLCRAKEVLFELEKTESHEAERMAGSQSHAPLPTQLSLFHPHDELLEVVRQIDINSLTPLEALNLLSRLKSLANG